MHTVEVLTFSQKAICPKRPANPERFKKSSTTHTRQDNTYTTLRTAPVRNLHTRQTHTLTREVNTLSLKCAMKLAKNPLVSLYLARMSTHLFPGFKHAVTPHSVVRVSAGRS